MFPLIEPYKKTKKNPNLLKSAKNTGFLLKRLEKMLLFFFLSDSFRDDTKHLAEFLEEKKWWKHKNLWHKD